MKKAKKIFLVTLIAALPFLFFGVTGKAQSQKVSAEPPCYDWGYKSSTTWEGRCISCDCDVWNFTGKTECDE